MSTSGPLSELLARWEELRARGVAVSAEDLCRATPELLAQFKEALTALKYVGSFGGASAGTVADPFGSTRPAGSGGGWPNLPGYEILGELGRGGIGVVYLARSIRLNKIVALKMLKTAGAPNPAELERFRREGQAMARLEHPHVVPVFAADEHAGRPYLTMKFLKGGNLAEQIPALSADPRRAVAVLEKVARAVQYLHAQKILHRDLKPLNILLDDKGEPYVSDFGLAKFLEPGLEVTNPGVPLGTWPYMAPEQVLGQPHRLGPATDVWSLGVMLYEVLTAHRPFGGDDKTELVRQILSSQPKPLRSRRPDLDEGLEQIVARCLRKEPAARYASAGALADDLAAYLRGDRRGGLSRRFRRGAAFLRKHRFKAVTVCLVLAAVVALGLAGLPLPGKVDTGSENRWPRETAAPLLLLGPQGIPADYQWLAGKERAALRPAPDGTCSLSSPDLVLLQLCGKVPWPRFRFEAHVRHDHSKDGGAGIYFGYSKRRIAQQDFHSFIVFDFAEQGVHRGAATLQFAHCREFLRTDLGGVQLAIHAFPLGRAGAGPAAWQQLAVEVTPERIRAYWGKAGFAQKDTKILRQQVASQLRGLNDVARELTLQGGVGILVGGSTASFRDITLRELP